MRELAELNLGATAARRAARQRSRAATAAALQALRSPHRRAATAAWGAQDEVHPAVRRLLCAGADGDSGLKGARVWHAVELDAVLLAFAKLPACVEPELADRTGDEMVDDSTANGLARMAPTEAAKGEVMTSLEDPFSFRAEAQESPHRAQAATWPSTCCSASWRGPSNRSRP